MMLHAEPQSNIKDRIRLHYYLRDHHGNTVVAFDDRNYDACPPVWRGNISDVEEGTQSEVIGRYHYYSRRDLGSSVEEPLARPSPALERDAFGERGCASHTKWLVAEVKRSVCPADRHGRSRSDSGVITLHAKRHEVLMRKQWNHAWVGSDIGGYWQQRYRYNGKPACRTGRELYSNSGLLDYGFRYYDPSVGRFTGVDPLADQMPSWSSYNYVFNKPILLIDPDGRAPDTIGVDKKGNVVFDDGKNDGNLFLVKENSGKINSLSQLKANSTQLVKDHVWIGSESQMVDYVKSQWRHAEGGFDWFPNTNKVSVVNKEDAGMAVSTLLVKRDGTINANGQFDVGLKIYHVGDKENHLLSSPYNTRNSISHEKMHLLQNVRHTHRELGWIKNSPGSREIEAINFQMSASTWNQTTKLYKQSVKNYLDKWR